MDLYRVVRQGIRASVESYSLKRLEPFCGYERTVDLPEVNEQMVLFEVGLDDATAAADTPAQELIAGYNEDDCRATLALRDWLETLRLDLESQLGEPLPRLVAPKKPEDHTDPDIADLRERLLAGRPEDETDRSPEERARALAADLLEWHRREDKPRWWRWFQMLRLSDEELQEEPDAISGLEFDGIVGEVARSNLLAFRFPPQEHPFDEGRQGFDRDDRDLVRDGPYRRTPLRSAARPVVAAGWPRQAVAKARYRAEETSSRAPAQRVASSRRTGSD